jgi:pimeloyl-ACP methyl ester carboxylesterase
MTARGSGVGHVNIRTMIIETYHSLANGQRLHALEAGRGPLMVLLHGFPEFCGMWRAQLTHFAGRYHVVAPDQRGYNLSSKPAALRDYRPGALVDDVLGLADALGHQRFTLVAHDWGGAIAWNVAAAHPERVERLVIVNAPHPVTFVRELRHNPAQLEASRYMTLFRQQRAEALLAEDGYRRLRHMSIEAWGANGGDASPATVAAYLEAWSQPGALTGMLNWYRASPLHPPEPDAALPDLDAARFRVNVPTLVIWGMRDQALLPGILDGLEEHVPDLRVEAVPDASHWVVHERPARVNDLIDRFVAAR